MRRSRLRVRLAIRFGAAFLVCLVALDLLLFIQLHRRDHRRLTADLMRTGTAFLRGIRDRTANSREQLPDLIARALNRWPMRADSFAVFDEAGRLLGIHGSNTPIPLLTAPPPSLLSAWEVRRDNQEAVRLVQVSDTIGGTPLRIVVARSTTALHRRDRLLVLWLGSSLPVVIILAVSMGYMLAARWVEPLDEMTLAIAAVAPGDFDQRLPVRDPPDELDVLANQFNGLLGRLADAQLRNRTFVAQAAHQLKTPLTIVRGETALGLDRPRSAIEYQASLRRIQCAADQMAHRVQSLLLLAHAQTGERPPIVDWVEVDAVAFECADLMRRRAQELQRTLALERVEPVIAKMSEVLLREALLELIENALRHGSSSAPVGISLYRCNGSARVEVASGGLPLASLPPRAASPQWGASGSDGLGLSIVQWIASVHGGTLSYARHDGRNVFAFEWPLIESEPLAG